MKKSGQYPVSGDRWLRKTLRVPDYKLMSIAKQLHTPLFVSLSFILADFIRLHYKINYKIREIYHVRQKYKKI